MIEVLLFAVCGMFQLEVGYMKHVFNVFERIGFTTGDSASDWDVLWSHDYPFRILGPYLGNLRPHQRVCSEWHFDFILKS